MPITDTHGIENLSHEKCCTPEFPCNEGEGDCENNDECSEDLVCGENNCKQFGDFFHERDDCCENSKISAIDLKSEPVNSNPKEPPEGKMKVVTQFRSSLFCLNQVKDVKVVTLSMENLQRNR